MTFKKNFLVASFLSLSATTVAHAQTQCPIDQLFSIRNVENYQGSSITTLIAHSETQHAKSDTTKQGGSVTLPVEGVPVTDTFNNDRAVSDWLLQKSGYQYTNEEKIAITRSALAPQVPEMLANCLNANHFQKVIYSQSAGSLPSFDITVQWTPGISAQQQAFVASASNAKVTWSPQKINDNEAATIHVVPTGRPGDVMSILFHVASDVYPNIDIPIWKSPIQYQRVRLRGKAVTKHAFLPFDTCDDPFTIESGRGASVQNKQCQLCVDADASHILLPTTAMIGFAGNLGHLDFKLDANASTAKVCATGETSVPASDPNQQDQIIGGYLTVDALYVSN